MDSRTDVCDCWVLDFKLAFVDFHPLNLVLIEVPQCFARVAYRLQ
jgi:hypothetical protein